MSPNTYASAATSKTAGSKTVSEKKSTTARKAAGPVGPALAARNAEKAAKLDEGEKWTTVSKAKAAKVSKKPTEPTTPTKDQKTVAQPTLQPPTPKVERRSPFAASVEDASESEMSEASGPGSPRFNRFNVLDVEEPEDEEAVQTAQVPQQGENEDAKPEEAVEDPAKAPGGSKKPKPKTKSAKAKGKAKAVQPATEDVFYVQPYEKGSSAQEVLVVDEDTDMSDASRPDSPTLSRQVALNDEEVDFIDLSTSPIKTRAQRASEGTSATRTTSAVQLTAPPAGGPSNKKTKKASKSKAVSSGHRRLEADGAEEWAGSYRSQFNPTQGEPQRFSFEKSVGLVAPNLVAYVSAPDASDEAQQQPMLVHPDDDEQDIAETHNDALPPSSPFMSFLDSPPPPPKSKPAAASTRPMPMSDMAARLSRIQARAPTLTTTRTGDAARGTPPTPKFPTTHDAYPGAQFASLLPEQVDAWRKAKNSKLFAFPMMPSGQDETLAAGRSRLLAQAIERHIVEKLRLTGFTVKVATPIADPGAARNSTAHLVYDLPDNVASALLAVGGITCPDISIRFVSFDITIPKLLFGISDWTSLSAEEARDIMYKAMTGAAAQEVWGLVQDEYGVQEHQARAFVKSLRVEILDIRAPGNLPIPRYNFFADGEVLGDDDAWFTVRDAFHGMEYPTVLNDLGLGVEFFECGICLGADHPRGLCPLPDVPGWLGPVRRPNQQNNANRGQGGFQRGVRGRGFGYRGINYRGRQ